MAQTTRRVCDRQKLKYPVTYVAPGNAPWLTRSLVKAVYGDKFGYRSACVYPHSAAKVFNELDPDGDAPYAMQWGDVGDDVGPCVELPALKNRIANLLALNKVVIVGSHVCGSPAYFEKMDGLLAWLKAKNIPVKSHAEWADILYRSGKRLTGNIFPSLDRDLDEDGKPDGYELANAAPEASPAEAKLPEKHMLTTHKPGVMFRIQGLGSLPHGQTEISFWCSGPAGTDICGQLCGINGAVWRIPLKEGWNRYTVPLVVPDACATIRVDFSWAAKVEGTVSICGISFSEQNTPEGKK
ncbi:MAG: hypothetical protein WCG36_06865 [bacterium]